MRVSVNLPEELVKKIDEAAGRLFISRSSYITMSVSQKLQADDLTNNLPAFLSGLSNLKETAQILEANFVDKTKEKKE